LLLLELHFLQFQKNSTQNNPDEKIQLIGNSDQLNCKNTKKEVWAK